MHLNAIDFRYDYIFCSATRRTFWTTATDPNNNNPLTYIIWFAPIVILMMYGQKFQSWMILGDISKSLAKLKNMKEKARNEAIEYIRSYTSSTTDQTDRIDKFLEYFTIMPVNLDPTGIIEKLDHIMRTRDDRIKGEIRKLVNTEINEIQSTRIENILEASNCPQYYLQDCETFLSYG